MNKKEYLINLRDFLSIIDDIKDDIKIASKVKMEWADDNLIHTINEDIMDYLLYLSTDDLYVNNLLQSELDFLDSVICVFNDYDHDKEFIELCSIPKKLHIDFLIKCYNGLFKDSEELRKVKFPLSCQIRIDTIPASMQQIRCYDQYFYEQNKTLFTVRLYNIYEVLGYCYLQECNNLEEKRLEKYNSFLKHIDNLTFSGVKLSNVIIQ